VLLAFAAADERRLMLEEQDQPEQLTPALEERLTRVRQQGFENMQSLQIAGVTNLSVPILGPMGRVLAVFTCPYSERLDVTTAPGCDAALQAADRLRPGDFAATRMSIWRAQQEGSRQ
jgi:DNA-binding IclR family transcriptional regulator